MECNNFYKLGAGLGLNGLLAHRLAPYSSTVVLTDGDINAMEQLRKNIAINQFTATDKNGKEVKKAHGSTITAAQLIWGLESSKAFHLEDDDLAAESYSCSEFSIIIASDVIYSAIVIDPLWETIRTLLTANGKFWMAFAKRKVPVTIEFVLQKARDYGFRYELVVNNASCDGDKNNFDYSDVDNLCEIEGDDEETGPVFIYVFRRDTTIDDEKAVMEGS